MLTCRSHYRKRAFWQARNPLNQFCKLLDIAFFEQETGGSIDDGFRDIAMA